MPIDPDRVRALFLHAVGKLSAEQWPGYLADACGSDRELLQQVEHLLCLHQQSGSFLERPAAHFWDTGIFGSEADQTLIEAQPEDMGTVIGPYTLVQPIGDGAMGVVFRAEQSQPVRRIVALKILKPGRNSQQIIARFEAERQALALMDHPHIAKVHDAGATCNGRPYFVMELVDGVPLTAFCDQHRLTVRERLELFVSICQAVLHAHQKGIIHRDLKPSNILVSGTDGKPAPKIIDFGIAKAMGPQLGERSLFTELGQIVGTPEYMSPEQADPDERDIDTRSDIYSLGVLLYELLTGTIPLDRRRLKEMGLLKALRLIREEEPPRPSARLSALAELAAVAANRRVEGKKLCGQVKGELDWIAMKCLEKDRNRRYETASALAVDVRHYLDDEPVQACPASAGYRFGKFARRNKTGLAMGGLILFFTVLLGGGLGWVVRDRAWVERDQVAQRSQAADASRLSSEARLFLLSAHTDLPLVHRLEAIRMSRALAVDGKFDNRTAEREYAAVFREASLGAEGEDAEAVAARIRASTVSPQLVAALDDWAARTNDAQRRTWLLEVARRTDPDARRARLRDPKMWRDRAALEALTGELLRDPEQLSKQQPPLLAALGIALLTAKADAVPFLTAAQVRHPDDFWLNFSLGIALSDAQTWREAIGYYRAALALRPQAAEPHLALGAILFKHLHNYDAALLCFDTAIRLDPKNAIAHLDRGNVLREKKQWEAAIRAYRRSIELNPQSAPAHSALAFALHSNNQLAEAAREYRKAIELDLNSAVAHSINNSSLLFDRTSSTAWVQRATELQHNKEHAKALALLREAVKIAPRNAEAAQLLAWLLVTGPKELRDAAEALPLARKAVELDPKQSYYRTTLGVALYRNGKFAEAVPVLERSLREGKGKSDAYDLYFLAMCHHRLGDAAKAKDCRRRAAAWVQQHTERAAIDAESPFLKELSEFAAEADAVLAPAKKGARE